MSIRPIKAAQDFYRSLHAGYDWEFAYLTAPAEGYMCYIIVHQEIAQNPTIENGVETRAYMTPDGWRLYNEKTLDCGIGVSF